jgi:hypothetical protein
MDKRRHPNVIRTWKLPHPVRGVSRVKSETQRRQRIREVPQSPKPQHRSQVEKPESK